MIKIIRIGVIIVILLSLNICLAQEYSLTVEVNGVEEEKGEISIGLFSDEENFPKGDVFDGTFVKAVESKVSHTFQNIPKGVYAIAIYHDINSNKKLDTNILGIPKEDYAFSNNVYGFFGPPKFKKTKFILTSDKTIKIIIRR